MRAQTTILTMLLLAAVQSLHAQAAERSTRIAALSAAPTYSQPVGEQDSTQLVLRRVWSGPLAASYGGLTPDGRFMTFVDRPRNDLALRDMRTGEVRHLTDRRAGDPEGAYPDESIISHDGKRVAYHWYAGGWVWELHVVDIDGSNRKILLRDVAGWAEPTDFTPDGRDLLVGLQREDDGPFALALVSISDGSTRVLREFDPGIRGDATFSPDGDYIIYDMEVPGESQRDVFILSVENRQQHTLIDDTSDDYVLGWVPGTDYVLFASDRAGTLGAWAVRVVDGRPAGPPILVKPDLWQARTLGFTENGAFYYGIRISTRGVHLATIDPETKRMLGEPIPIDPRELGTSQRPRWSPDGRYLAYIRINGAMFGMRIAIRSMETGETREIEADFRGRSAPRWSPDGRYFLCYGDDENDRRGFFRVDVQSGATVPLKILENNGASFWADWAPDGKAIYYRVDYGEESRIEVLDLETGEARMLRSVHRPSWIVMIYVDVSPDGEHLAFWERGREKMHLYMIPTAPSRSNEPARELVAFDRRSMGGNVGYVRWTPDGQYVLYQVEEGESARLWRVPVAGGDPEPTELLLGEYPQFSPDGRRIAFDYGEQSGEIWVMQNYLPEAGTKD
jgi:Tol biopolymer transport system component